MSTITQTTVNLAEWTAGIGPTYITCPGIGSGIAVVALDKTTHTFGAAHFMLPHPADGFGAGTAAKYADPGIDKLIKLTEETGATFENMVFALAGGAQGVRRSGTGFDLGHRNLSAMATALKRLGGRVLGADIGGSSGRILTFDTLSGNVLVQTLQGGERLICNLRG